MSRIRFVTYNIHKCRGLDRRVRTDRIAQILREIHADVIALQEVFSLPGHAPEADQAQYLADQLEMQLAWGGTRQLLGASYGNAVLSRFPSVATHCYDISVAGREARGCLRTDVETAPGTVLHVFNVHMGTNFFERRRQGRKLVEEVLHWEGRGPRIVLGDFNEWIPGLASELLKAHLKGADIRVLLPGRRTYPGVFPLVHLDHIYYDEEFELVSVELRRDWLTLVASDHLPLVAESLAGGRTGEFTC